MTRTAINFKVGPQSRDANKQFASVLKNMREFIRTVQNDTPEIMLDALQPTFDLSQVYVPKDTGELKDSGYLAVTGRGRKPRVEIGYGKYGSPSYAVLQHENLEFRHEAPTRSKYLAAAVDETAGQIRTRLITRYREYTRTSGSINTTGSIFTDLSGQGKFQSRETAGDNRNKLKL